MSGLLQRLAGQALGAQASGTPRIRPAVGVHAQVPMGLPRETEDTRPMPTLVPELPQSQTADSRVANPAQRARPREFTTIIQPVGAAHEFASQEPPHTAAPAEAQSIAPPAPRETPHRRASYEFADKAPRPLLEEVQAHGTPPAIALVAPPRVVAPEAPDRSSSEPTEVHVHIGRIEVIAAPEPAAPKKNCAAPARNTLPLADYLARRRRS